MSSGFTFGAKPNEPAGFGQAPPAFGTQFNAPPPVAATAPQFGSTFGAKTAPGGFQLASPAASATTFGAPSFNFNAAPAQPSLKPPATTLSFGTSLSGGFPLAAPATTASAGSMFGTAPNLFGTAAPSGAIGSGLTFGTPKSTAGPGFLFNTPSTAANTGLVYGTPASTATGATFGTAASAVPGLGLGMSIPPTGLNLSATTSTPGLNLGASTPATGLTFGTPTSSTGLTFGTSAAATPPTFGTSAAPSTGLPFGISLPTQPAPNTALAFATAAASAPNTKPSFGVPASAATNLTFPTPQSSAPATGLSFAVPASSALGGNAGTFASTVPTAILPPPASSTQTTAPMFVLAPASTAGNASYNFGMPAATTTVAATTTTGFGQSLGIGSAATSESLSFGLGGTLQLKPPASAASVSFGAQPVSTATTLVQHTVGLGGVSATPPKPPTGGGTTTGQADVAPRDQVIPNELLQTVEHFKKFLQEQKTFSSEIARFSMKDLKRVENEIELVNNCMTEMKNELQKNKAVADTLQLGTAKDLQNAEMAQRTFDTPAGLQYDNTAPFNYFIELSNTFEKDMHDLKVRIENIDKHVRYTGPPTTLSSQELALGMRRLHETFVALAGRLQSIHNQVESQKEQYLNLRRQMLNDYTNVFEHQSKELESLEIVLDSLAHQPPTVSMGPTPFSSLGNSQAQVLAQNPPPGYPTTTPLGPPPATGFNTTGQNNMLLFGSSVGHTSSLFNPSSATAFQLQKPPVGNKRGKP